MRCQKEGEKKFVELRSAIIRQILNTRNKYCPELKPKEFLIHSHFLQNYPHQWSYEITMCTVARAIARKEPNITLDDEALSHTPNYPFLPLRNLLLFEPYRDLGVDLLRKIFDNEQNADQAVPKEMITEIFKAMRNQHESIANELLSPSPTQRDWTYGDLFHILSQHSIFAGRNPLVS